MITSATPATVTPRRDADFDGDGRADLAFAGGLREVKDAEDDGVVVVVYGTSMDLKPGRVQTWSEMTFTHQPTLTFGSALTTGDFDGDGFSDLAVGADNTPVDDATEHAGYVRILYGSREGLTAARSQRWTQNSPGIAGHAESNDGFGCSLAASNLGHGPEDDLAIGVHGENDDSGAVNVLYGSPQGLSARYNQVWSQSSPGIVGVPEQDDAFGLTLVTGRFRDSAYADLAIGVYVEHIPGSLSSGAVHVINGSADGLTATGSQFFTQHSLGIDGEKVQEAAFSFSMAVGRFRGGTTDDLAVGAPFAGNNSGLVHVLYSSPTGLRTDGAQVWTQASPGISETPEIDDTFGWAVTAGSFGRDTAGRRFDDLVVRVPGELTHDADEAGGAVTVLYGGPDGLASSGSQILMKGLTSDALGIDVSWRRQLTAAQVGSADLDLLVVGSEDWIALVPATEDGLASKGTNWTPHSLGHSEIWTGLADKVAG